MVREYVKITARGTTSLEVMEEAARRVIDKKQSLRTMVADFDVGKTLLYHVYWLPVVSLFIQLYIWLWEWTDLWVCGGRHTVLGSCYF